MNKGVLCVSAMALISVVSACGGNQAVENNIVTEDLNGIANLPQTEPATNAATEEAANEAVRPDPAATRTAPAKPAPAKPEPAPAPEPEDPHAGHDMNNMQ